MDKGDLLPGYSSGDKFFPDVIIDIEGSVSFRRREVTKTELGGAVLFRVPPDIEHVLHASVDLALRVIREHRIDQALIKGTLPAVIRDLEHVVFCRLHSACPDSLSSVCERGDKLLLLLTGL